MAQPVNPTKPSPFAAANAARARKREQQLAARAALDSEDEFGESEPSDDISSSREAVRARARTIARAGEPDEPLKASAGVGNRGIEREVMRGDNGRVIARGRDGQLLTRKRNAGNDPFDIPKAEIPVEWSYQWIAVTVIGKEQKLAGFGENGWTPVPRKRHPHLAGTGPGVQITNAHEPIVVDGLMLVERPKALTEEAREEEVMAARNLIRTQNEQFTPRLPGARSNPRAGLKARRSIERMPDDIGSPSYEMAVDDGLLS